MLIFGLGYSAAFLKTELQARGWEVHSTGSAGNLRFDDEGTVRLAISQATHILSSVPPLVDGDPVLAAYGDALRDTKDAWLGYLSSTGVYGDCGGAWVDESAPIRGRRLSRNEADAEWMKMGARVFRLPGIYGPGRSALDRVEEGRAHRVDLPNQIFSRVHVGDIVSGVIAGFDGRAGAYNLSDDLPCSQNLVIEAAAQLLGMPVPPIQSLDESQLSPAALAFYAENRRVSNRKAKRLLGWSPGFPTYVEGLRALRATSMPSKAITLPAIESNVH